MVMIRHSCYQMASFLLLMAGRIMHQVAAHLIVQAALREHDLLIDYEHQTLPTVETVWKQRFSQNSSLCLLLALSHNSQSGKVAATACQVGLQRLVR